MKRKTILMFSIAIGAAAVLGLLAGLALARVEAMATAATTAPTVISYQGEVLVGGEPYSGTGYFKFAVVDTVGGTSYWSNDGTHLGSGDPEPDSAVSLTVTDGLFSVLLGNTALTNMNQAITADIFADRPRRLQVWFDEDGVGTFTDLGRTFIAAVPYALNAETLDGLDSEAFQQNYDHVIVVAKSGGDYTSIQAALDSISDNDADSRYLVWVAPGVYSETVTMKPYVHIQGAGQELTIISSTVGNTDHTPVQATLVLTRNVSLRDLTVSNRGTITKNVALLATAGTTQTLVADVTVQTQGNGLYNNGICLVQNSDSHITLHDVTALAENASVDNYGLNSLFPSTVRGGSFTGRGGGDACGILAGGSSLLVVEGATALGEGGSTNAGLHLQGGPTAVLRGGSFTARGGSNAYGIWNGLGATLEAERVTALAENSTTTYGLYNKPEAGDASATVTHSVLEGTTHPAYFVAGAGGAVTLYHTRLVSSNPVSGTGTITCVGVSRGITFTVGTTCP